MKILIPVDGSEHTKRAITYFFEFRAIFDLKPEIMLLHVRAVIPKAVAASLRPEVLEEHDAAETEAAMGWTRKRFLDSKVPFEQTVLFGKPSEKIVEHAKERQYDLILMGSRGHGTLPGMTMGSTTLKVLAACTVPVLVVR